MNAAQSTVHAPCMLRARGSGRGGGRGSGGDGGEEEEEGVLAVAAARRRRAWQRLRRGGGGRHVGSGGEEEEGVAADALPVEYEIDQKLNITHRDQVLAMGVDKYNDTCRGIVTRYTKEPSRPPTREATLSAKSTSLPLTTLPQARGPRSTFASSRTSTSPTTPVRALSTRRLRGRFGVGGGEEAEGVAAVGREGG
jgi:hypothetical protein